MAIMSLAVLFCACDLLPNDDTSEPTKETTAAESTPIIAEPEKVEHEIRDYFVIDNGIDKISFANISKLDGKIVEVDEENNLISVEIKDLDNHNNVIQTIKVYDITTGECIRSDSVTYPLYATGKDVIDFKVEIDYPIIRVSKTSYSEDGDDLKPQYEVNYYFAKKDGENVHSTKKTDYSKTYFSNGLVAFEMGEKVFWINRNMEVVRTVNAIAANGYYIDRFDAEYQDYLYAWNEEEIQVFNKAGFCSAKYNIGHDGFIKVHVLNDGNVLIQDFETVDAYTACDFVWSFNSKSPAKRINMTSYVMSCTDGTLKEVELDFIVEDLETAYEGRLGNNSFPFALAGNGQNQAYIYRIANGKISLWQEYVSLGNDLEIKYSVKNSKIGAAFNTAEVINSNFYRMNVSEGGITQSYIFDLDGNVITASAEYTEITNTYIFSGAAIYDHKMNLIYDIYENGFISSSDLVDTSTNTIYMVKHNFNTGADEVYVFDHVTKSPKLLIGNAQDVMDLGEGYYVTYDTENNEASVIATASKNVILKALQINDIRQCADAVIVETVFEGNTLVYIIK